MLKLLLKWPIIIRRTLTESYTVNTITVHAVKTLENWQTWHQSLNLFEQKAKDK